MAKIPEYLNTLNGWTKVLAARLAHAAELPYLAETSSRLENLLQLANSLSAEHTALTANKQDVGQRLQPLRTRSRPAPPPTEKPDPESPPPPPAE